MVILESVYRIISFIENPPFTNTFNFWPDGKLRPLLSTRHLHFLLAYLITNFSA